LEALPVSDTRYIKKTSLIIRIMRHFFTNMKTEQLYDLFKESAGISTDSRKVSKGQLFFALWGDNYNGNKFAAEAIEKGASWAVIDDPLFETDKTILVDDCLLELQALATYHRKQLNIPVLAISGTNGKTTTKELLALIIGKKLKVHSTQGNLNNHIGVPVTILSSPAGTDMMIIEMGANHIGEIRTLCLIARPDYGIITNIGTAHIEGFGSFEGVVKAKTELYEYLRKVNGIALYNDMNHLLTEKIFKNVNRAVPFSNPTGTELLVEQIPSDLNLLLNVTYQHRTFKIQTNLFGNYNLENVKAAIATGLFFEIRMKDIADALENYHPANNRSQIKTTKSNILVCDSYNANPTSMHAALESFAAINTGQKLVILGDMLELGEKSEDEHSRLLDELKSYNLENVILVGPVFQKVSPETGFRSFSDADQVIEFFKSNPVRGNTVLIKGSRGMKLEKIYDLL
jgi:UDP-N-acetylmuramoyl-tripeptide--D-alanyl-D-alanine ligase